MTGCLTLLFILASCAVLLVLGWVIAASVEQHFQEQAMESLKVIFTVTTTRETAIGMPMSPMGITSLCTEHCVGLHFLKDGPRRIDFQFPWPLA